MVVALGGRVAENIIFKEASSGAADDLNKVTEMAYKTILEYGMGECLPQLSYGQYHKSGFSHRAFSDKTAFKVDNEVKEIIRSAYQRAEAILLEKKVGLEALAKLLLEKETLNQDEVAAILGPRPFTDSEDLAIKYLNDNGMTAATPSPV